MNTHDRMATIEKLQELKIPPNTDPSQEKGFLVVKSANQWIEEAKEYKSRAI